MAENVVVQNAEGEDETYPDVSGVELRAAGGGTATFIHVAEILQPDWAQTDSTKKDYIKNKPALKKVATEGTYAALKDRPFGDIPTPLAETEISFELDENFNDCCANVATTGEMLLGETYKVVWDGVEYLRKCTDGVIVEDALEIEGGLSLGNKSLFMSNGLEGTGEPFFICWVDGELLLIANDNAGSHTVSITPVNSVQKLDKKYLPDGLATEEYVQAEIAKIEVSGGGTGGKVSWGNVTDKPFEDTYSEVLEEIDANFQYIEEIGCYGVAVMFGSEDIPVFPLALGDECVVVWDGEEYKVTVGDASSVLVDKADALFVGNGSIVDLAGNNEPFSIMWDSTGVMFISAVDTESKKHTFRIYQGALKCLDNKYIPAPPEFDLTAMGLPALTMDGTSVSVACDTAELCAALDKGTVKLLFQADIGMVLDFSGNFNAIRLIGGDYQCSFLGIFETPALLNFVITKTSISGSITAM